MCRWSWSPRRFSIRITWRLLVAAGASAVVPYLADQFAESLEAGGAERMRTAINAGSAQSFGAHGRFDAGELSQQPSVRDRRTCRRISARNFSRMSPIFRGRRVSTTCLNDYLRMHTAGFSGAVGRSGRLRACIASAKARSCTPIRRKSCGGCTRTCKRRTRGSMRRLRNWRRTQGPVFLRDLLETVPAYADSDRGSRAGRRDRAAFQHAGDVARFAWDWKRTARWRWR